MKDDNKRQPDKDKSKDGIELSSLYKNEDWWAVWLGFIILGLTATGIVALNPKIGKWTIDVTASINVVDIPSFVLLAFFLLVLTSAAILAMREKLKGYCSGFPAIFLIALVSFLIASQSFVNYLGLENVLWALLIGLLISNTIRVPSWLKPAAKTELFIKIGLVLLGAEILFQVILTAGALGLYEVTIGLVLVWYFCYYVATKLGLGKSFASIMATATSVCGVSAAIAAGGAVKGDPKEVSYTISLVLLFAMPLLILMPMIARALNMSDVVAGAWFGGTIDTTPAVVAAGALYSDKAMAIASIVKMSQNIMIGVTAFLLSLYWVVKVERKSEEKPNLMDIWYRFPKFILGFIIASIVFSFLLVPMMGEPQVNSILKITKGIRGWFFTLAFVSIGLNTKLRELVRIGGKGKPLIVFGAATIFDIVISLISAYVFFGGLFFPPPL